MGQGGLWLWCSHALADQVGELPDALFGGGQILVRSIVQRNRQCCPEQPCSGIELANRGKAGQVGARA